MSWAARSLVDRNIVQTSTDKPIFARQDLSGLDPCADGRIVEIVYPPLMALTSIWGNSYPLSRSIRLVLFVGEGATSSLLSVPLLSCTDYSYGLCRPVYECCPCTVLRYHLQGQPVRKVVWA